MFGLNFFSLEQELSRGKEEGRRSGKELGEGKKRCRRCLERKTKPFRTSSVLASTMVTIVKKDIFHASLSDNEIYFWRKKGDVGYGTSNV